MMQTTHGVHEVENLIVQWHIESHVFDTAVSTIKRFTGRRPKPPTEDSEEPSSKRYEYRKVQTTEDMNMRSAT